MNDLSPGFGSPLEAQACFRAILDAFSTPGRIISLPVKLTPPPGLSVASAIVLLTLADTHTKIALPQNSTAYDWLRFHTGAPSADLATADFCVASTRPALTNLRQGTDATPEDGATLILDVERLEGALFELFGPGLQTPVTMPLPLDPAFIEEWQTQSHNAPRGVDIILCAGQQILALPRSLQIKEG